MTDTQTKDRPANGRNGRARSWRLSRLMAGSERELVGIVPCADATYRAVRLSAVNGQVKSIEEAKVLGREEEDAPIRWKQSADTCVVLAMPRQETILKRFRVPSVDPHQIAQMMPYETATHSPWPPEETQATYEIVDTGEDGYACVLLSMVHREAVNRHLEQLKSFGIRVTHVEASVLSVARLLRHGEDQEHPAILIVDADGSTYVRLTGGYPAFSRGADRDETPLEMFRKSVEVDARRNGNSVGFSSLVLAGGALDGMEVNEPGPQGRPVSDIFFSVLNGAGPIQPGDAICVGAALAGMARHSGGNLLPERHARALQQRLLWRRMCVTAALVLWCIVAAAGAVYFAIAVETKRATRLEGKIAALEGQAGNLREKDEALALLLDERRQVTVPLRSVLELYARTPPSVALNTFRVEAHGGLVFGGEAPSFPVVYEYLDKLLESDLFRNVEMKYGASPREGAGQGLVEFKVTCTVREQGKR